MNTRRSFIKKTLASSVLLAAGGMSAGYGLENPREQRKLTEKLRIIIETDAGGDPDDEQSMVRFLLYANEFDIEGIIANRRIARTPENQNPIRDGLGIVRDLVKAYGECYPNLVRHDSEYPEEEYLYKRTVPGYTETDDGVDLIVKAVDAPDPRPVWFCNWGTDNGSAISCLKRALDKVLATRGTDGYSKFKKRLRLSSYDKFDDHTTTIDPPFPIWIDTFRPPIDGKRWYHRFSALTAKAGGFNIENDVLNGHGPLGARYPMNTGLKQKEGDTMTFLFLIPTGMNDPNEPTWGSWGGRYGLNEENPGKNYFWANQEDNWNGSTNRDNTLARWAEALQNDFRVRMDWCVKPYNETNHHPVAIINGNKGKEIIKINTSPGNKVELNAGKSYDPDGRLLIPKWFIYNEAGTCKKDLSLSALGGMKTSLLAPEVNGPEKVHIVLELRNDGKPALYSYRRVIININPS